MSSAARRNVSGLMQLYSHEKNAHGTAVLVRIGPGLPYRLLTHNNISSHNAFRKRIGLQKIRTTSEANKAANKYIQLLAKSIQSRLNNFKRDHHNLNINKHAFRNALVNMVGEVIRKRKLNHAKSIKNRNNQITELRTMHAYIQNMLRQNPHSPMLRQNLLRINRNISRIQNLSANRNEKHLNQIAGWEWVRNYVLNHV